MTSDPPLGWTRTEGEPPRWKIGLWPWRSNGEWRWRLYRPWNKRRMIEVRTKSGLYGLYLVGLAAGWWKVLGA